MNQLLELGDRVITESGTEYTVTEYLGGGGQGEVYKADCAGQEYAVKWYFSQYRRSDETLRARLETAIDKGSPSARFLWPTDLVHSNRIDNEGFGYVMALRESHLRGLNDLVTRRISPTFYALITAGYQLADSFQQLHTRGLCYCDISFGNVFLAPDSGDVRICDNDNVTIDDGQSISILGTPRFMAPEIVRGEAKPSVQTDRYSLAVLLFYMLTNSHPLDGTKEDAIHAFDALAMRKLYGTEPVFIFDPDDDSNRPAMPRHANATTYWQIYPTFLKDLFVKAFTHGLRDPMNGRIEESVWRGAMLRLRDTIFYCPHCKRPNFFDADRLKAEGELEVCWSCQGVQPLPARMRIDNPSLKQFVGSDVVAFHPSLRLFPHHVDPGRTFDFGEAVADVSAHPRDPNLLGLKNLTNRTWVCHTAEGEMREVEPGRSFAIKTGARINFGKAEGACRI